MGNFDETARLATQHYAAGNTEAAIEAYKALLENQSRHGAAHFNLAWLYRRAGQPGNALTHYEKAIEYDVPSPEDAWYNMGVIYSELRNGDEATAMFEKALGQNPAYVPAMFGIATHYEEIGDKTNATAWLERVLRTDDRHWQALARLAYMSNTNDNAASLIARIQAVLSDTGEPDARETLSFALAKLYDDTEQYERAASAYTEANDRGKANRRVSSNESVEKAFDWLIDTFDPEWIDRNSSDSLAEPVFICGMYRSGSTLLEQMLSGHPDIVAAGELDILPLLLGRYLTPFAEKVATATASSLGLIGREYAAALSALFPGERYVTDKRPDNFLHLGLIKAIFPRARIIHTRRQPLDNCLSIYFQQLDPSINYAADLTRIAHYRCQHDRLMNHWSRCFGSSIFSVDYEELVTRKEAVLEPLLAYLDLSQDAQIDDFRDAKTAVKTASVWQVREKLHIRSIDRWQRYPELARTLERAFATYDAKYRGIKA